MTEENTLYKPSLLTRLYDGFMNYIQDPVVQYQTGGAANAASVEQIINSSFSPGFLKRSLLRLFVFDLSMLTTAYVIKVFAIDRMIMNYKANEERDKPSFKIRYTRLVLIYLVFLLISFTLYEFIATNILFLCVKFYVHVIMTKPKDANAGELTNQVWSSIWDTFMYFSSAGQVEQGNTGMFFILLLLATVGVYVFFMLYTLFVKDVVFKMQYPTYKKDLKRPRNDEDEDIEVEDDVTDEGPRDDSIMYKFLVHQSVMITFVLLFGIGFTISHYISDASLGIVMTSIFMFILLFIYALIYCTTIKFQLQKNMSSMIKSMLWLLTYVWIVYLLL